MLILNWAPKKTKKKQEIKNIKIKKMLILIW